MVRRRSLIIRRISCVLCGFEGCDKESEELSKVDFRRVLVIALATLPVILAVKCYLGRHLYADA